MSGTRTVLVVGGGVIGVCAAYYLARDGWEVTLVDRAEIAAGSSYGNAGLIVPSHAIPLAAPGALRRGLRWMVDPESPFYVKPRFDPKLVAWLWRFRAACTTRHVARAMPLLRDLSYASLALYRELRTTAGFDFGYREDGILQVFRTSHARHEAVAEVARLAEVGITARVLDAREAREIEPCLRDGTAGAVLYPDDAHLDPAAFVTGLARLGEEKMGVTVRPGTEVLGFRTDGRRVVAVDTTRGVLEPGAVVLAAGAWSRELAGTLSLTVPLQAAKGYSVTYRRPPEGPRIPLLLAEARVAVTPMADILRLAGTLELAGLDLSINRRRVAAVIRSAAAYVAGLDRLELLEIWRGLRPCAPDGLPIVGRPGRLDNVIVATGHAMIGISLGPITGKLVTELLAGHRPTVDVSALSPDRFGRRPRPGPTPTSASSHRAS